MNKLLTQIIDGILAVVPLERVVAHGLNALIARIGQAPTAKTAKTLAHIREAVDIAERVIRDGQVTPEEVTEVKERAQLLRLGLLGTLVIDGGDDIWVGATTNHVFGGITNKFMNGINVTGSTE